MRSCRQVEAAGQGETVAAGDVGKALTSPAGARYGKEGPCALGAAAGVPAPAVEKDRARSAQARRAGTVPAAPQLRGRCPRPGRGSGRWAGPGPPSSFPRAAGGAERWRLPGSSGAASMGMAQGPEEELAPRGRTGYSDAELVKAEGRLLSALSAKQRHGRPPGVSALPRDPHPITLRPLPPPPPPPPPPPRRPPAHSTHSPIMQRENRCRRHVTSGRRWLGRGRALVGAGGWGGGHSGEISVTERLPLRRRSRSERRRRRSERRPPFWVRASCPFS